MARSARNSLERLHRRPLLAVAVVAFATQLASATWWLKPYAMPNISLVIASNLVSSGRYEGGNWVRLNGSTDPNDPPLRSYHLPGEPLYLAAGLELRHERLFDYWHVPIAILLVLATAASAFALFGSDAALVTGVVAALDPVTVIHGPVFDDTFLAAALLWLVAAIALRRWANAVSANSNEARASWIVTVALGGVAGWAAVTRTETLVAIATLAVCCLAVRVLRPLRATGVALASGVLLAVGAWATRNVIVQHHILIGSSHDGVTLWESTEPSAPRALTLGQVDALSTDPAIVGALWRETAGKDEVGANHVFQRAAIQEIAADPVRVAELAARKVVTSVAGVRPELPMAALRNIVSLLTTAVLTVLAAVGVARVATSPSQIQRVAGIGACVLGVEVLAVLALGPVGVRYWILWRPVLWILAGRALLST